MDINHFYLNSTIPNITLPYTNFTVEISYWVQKQYLYNVTFQQFDNKCIYIKVYLQSY